METLESALYSHWSNGEEASLPLDLELDESMSPTFWGFFPRLLLSGSDVDGTSVSVGGGADSSGSGLSSSPSLVGASSESSS